MPVKLCHLYKCHSCNVIQVKSSIKVSFIQLYSSYAICVMPFNLCHLCKCYSCNAI